jgi:DNA phosphorothioation system restriction enzyme
MLTDKKWSTLLTSSDCNMVSDFFVPALERSIKYDRGVGFFSSGWVRVASSGMLDFAKNHGRARWVTSPILSKEDWEALYSGDQARSDPALKAALMGTVSDLGRLLEKDTLRAISWMIADEIIEFKLALPRERLAGGEFHDKFGIFTDKAGNRVAFNGSYNDSIQGLRNYESIKVFCSWEPAFADLVEADDKRFERLWNNDDPNVRVFNLPDAVKEAILKLRTSDRPYEKPAWVEGSFIGTNENATRNSLATFEPPPDFVPREYQKEAMREWLKAGGRGILAMATGTGKTATALYLSYKVAEKMQALVLIVVCPYINLARQWVREMARFNLFPVCCFEGKNNWLEPLQEGITAVLSGSSSLLSIVVTNRTFLSTDFQSLLRPDRVKHFLIADEVHNLGAKQLQRRLDSRIQYRLGLSATPKRHADEDGTAALFEYFGGIVFEFPLGKAIEEGMLCRYLYYPILVDLTAEEGERYWELSQQIARQAASNEGEEMSEALKMLLIQRARLLASAANKLPALSKVLDELDQPAEQAIVYCGDGRVENDASADAENERQIEAVLRLLGNKHRLRVRKFTCDESVDEREEMLERLRDRKLDAIVAIRCLDEGIDVPDVRMAFILASSTNPRQFIQRRGRLLRRAPGKSRAHIWDFVVKPPDLGGRFDSATFNTERGLFKRELERIVDFCRTAENGDAALNQLLSLRKTYNLLSY